MEKPLENKPIVLGQLSQNVSLKELEPFVLDCTITGDPKPEVDLAFLQIRLLYERS